MNAKLRLVLASATALASAASATAEQQAAPYTVVESGRSFTRLQDAVNAIGGGTGTIRFASMRFADCAVQDSGDVTYQAEVPGQAVLLGALQAALAQARAGLLGSLGTVSD